MKCPKCGHTLADESKTCMYCGEALQGPGPDPAMHRRSKWRHFVQSEGQKTNLSENSRRKVEGVFPKGRGAVTAEEESLIGDPSSPGAKANQDALPLQKVLTLLSGLRDSFSRGDMDYDVYEHMAAGIIKDFVSALDDDVRTAFVLNEIADSDLSDYLTDDMLRDLRALVLASIA